MIDLYRFYGEDDALLYVGISLSAAQRAANHRANKAWWPEVARMEVEHLAVNRKEAETIESEAIRSERPLHNVAHATAPLPARQRWPDCLWIAGKGNWASVSRCGGAVMTTVMLFGSYSDATAACRRINVGRCGAHCEGYHEVVRVRT